MRAPSKIRNGGNKKEEPAARSFFERFNPSKFFVHMNGEIDEKKKKIHTIMIHIKKMFEPGNKMEEK